ncbi:uncharacterized protein KD926_001338 [Aspergillus affinis]|uniref:uncharacterized protein n=1 Tax=Aspergillus affinis TaxID=1070780 RepID=UPI0022FDCB78|nr:uncharacterized protein KD926_001338 [Aspergillus affinis]KAI9036760.1 hypothetical protein KD926_001338 [Aspergillus affinis]
MVLSVNSQRDIDKHFEGTNIYWTAVEKQQLAWAHLARRGKKIRLQISINYIEDSGPPSRTEKRGKSSVTTRMIADRDAQIDAEQISGHHSVWRDVYRVMRCPGPPCRHGLYVLPEALPQAGMHPGRFLHTEKFLSSGSDNPESSLISGGNRVLETHNYVPDSVREQLYDEENQQVDKKKKAVDYSTMGSMCPPININVLPAGAFQQPMHTPANDTMPTTPGCTESIMIDGLLDVAVEEYTEWQQSRVSNETFRENITKAHDVTIENCLDLMQIYEGQDPGFFVKHGVKVGAARRFVRDIGLWVKRRKEMACNQILI